MKMATKLGSLTLDLICRTGRFTQGMRDASNSASREMGRIESSTNAVNSMFKQLAATAAATFTVSQVVNYADSYTGMVNKLKLVTTTQTELKRAMDDTNKIALGTASDWAGVVDVYAKFQKISDRLGLSQKEVARITETVTKSVSMSGASADEAQRSLIQFSQGLSLGVLRGQDLNSVMQQTPGLTDAIAKGMGVTSDKLKQMGADNVLTTESVVTALKKVADSVDEEYAKTATTVASSFNLIKTESIRMIGEFDSATGASAKFVQGMTVLSQNMDTVTNTLMIGGAYMVGSYIPAIALGTKTLISDTIVRVANIAAARSKAIADYDVAKSNLAATAAMVRAMGVTNAQTAAMMTNARTAYQQAAAAKSAALANTTLSSAILGPVGLGVAVASVAAGFLLMRDSSKDTQSALEEQGLTVDELKVKYSQLNAEQLKLKALGASDAIEAENDKIASSLTSLKQYISDLNAQGETGQSKSLQQYLSDLQAGGERAKTAFANLEKQSIVSPHSLKMAAEVGSTVKTSNKEIDKQNQILSIASNKHLDHAKAAKTGAEGVGKVGIEAVSAAAKVKNLGEEVQKFINDSLNSTTDNLRKYQLISQGYTSATADMILAAEKAEGVNGTGGPLSVLSSSVLATQILSQKKLTDLVDERTEAEKKVNDELKKRKELQEMVGASALSGLRIKSSESVAGGKVRGYTAEFAQLTQDALGDKLGRFTSFNDAYHKGTNSKHATGNAFDFTTKSAKDAELAIARLNTLAKQYGFTIKTLNEYSNPSARATGGHVHVSVLGYKGGEEALKDAKAKLKIDQDYNADRKKEADEVDQFLQQYSNADVVRNKKRIAEISEAERLGQTQLTSKINERFANETRLSELQLEEQLKGWGWTEDKKLKHQAEINKTQIALSTELDDIEKQLHKESIDDQLAYELAKSKLVREQQLLQSKEFYMSELQLAKAKYDIERRLLAESNVDPKEKAFKSQMLELQNQVDMNRRLKDASIGWDSVQSQMNGSTGRFQVNQDKFSRMGASQNLFDTQIADVENQEQEPGADLQKLAEVREQIWAAHNQRMIDIENQYQTDSLNLQLTQAQQLTGSFANMFKGILGESSGAYKTMFAMQQGFALAQAGMNLWSSVSDAYAKEPGTVWQKVAAGAKAALDQGTFLAMIQAITPQGFATGGHITGKGTGTSDDIPIMASNGEFMMKASAVSKLGLSALNYMNLTGQIPEHSNYMSMNSQSNQSDLSIQKFKDGGEIGVPRLNYTDVDSRRFNSIPKNSSQGEGGGDIKIEVNITDSGVNTSGGNTQNQKQLGDAIGNAVRAVIIREKRQGGLLSK